jgi:GT2 family glycosyltransferase
MNQGIDSTLAQGADAVLLLTHECRLAPDALEILLRRLTENPSVGAVGPLLCLLRKEEEVFSAGALIDPRTWEMQHLGMRDCREDWVDRGTLAVDWIDGACILMRSEVIRQVGHMDERYFLYFEETEYLVRVRRQGWRVECAPRAVAWQQPGLQPAYLNVRNKLGFLAKNAPKRCLFRAVVRLFGKLARDVIHPRTSYARGEVLPQLKGLIDFAVGRWGPPT